MSGLYKSHNYYPPIFIPDHKPSTLKNIKIGSCDSFAHLFIYFARASGIPVTFDFAPKWANHAMGHQWAAIHTSSGVLDFLPRDKHLPGEHLAKFSHRIAKVYRKTYADQSSSLGSIRLKSDEVPPLFLSKKMIDVTDEYVPTGEFSIEQVFNFKRNKYAYLSVFDNRGWAPIAWAKNNKGELSFGKLGYPAVYLPVSYRQKRYLPIQYPVLIDSAANLKYLQPDLNHTQTIILTRKYKDDNPAKWVKEMQGGFFELSNDETFSIAKRIAIPHVFECNYQLLPVNDGLKYRYFRYVPPPGSRGEIAEIALYDSDSVKIDGEIVGNYPLIWHNAQEKAFDNDVLSYAASTYLFQEPREDAWIGLKLDSDRCVKQIEFLPRNDDNFIREGEVYELFYWDNRWISLGEKLGCREKQRLKYEGVPINALFLLRNLTKGKEERIFTYENDRQIWW